MKKLLPPILLIIIIATFLFGAFLNANSVNTEIVDDQVAYIYAIKKTHEEKWYMGDRNRMPLYVYFQTILYVSSMSDEELFIQAKAINIFLSLFLLFFLYFIAKKILGKFNSLTFTLISAFTLFILKAGYVQVELLYYFLFFICFLLLAKLISKDNWKLAALTGFTCAITYLAKASILPAIALFVLFSIIKIASSLLSDKIKKFRLPKFEIKKILTTNLALILTFIIVLSPYLIDTKRIYGHYFYNVNTTFYMWYDSWAEVLEGTAAHGDREGWPDMPEEEIPTMNKYLREHSLREIIGREYDGFVYMAKNFIPKAYEVMTLRYIVIYLLALGINIVLQRKKYWQLTKKHYLKILFTLAFISGYLASFAWYVAIDKGPRFIQALILPVLFSLILALKVVPKEINLKNKKTTLLAITNIFLLICLVADVYLLLKYVLHGYYFLY